jgi:hypothetical protein
MAAGVTKTLWKVADIVKLAETEAKVIQTKSGAYKKRLSAPAD